MSATQEMAMRSYKRERFLTMILSRRKMCHSIEKLLRQKHKDKEDLTPDIIG